MTKKEIKNREIQNEFVAKLQNCLNAFDEADKLYDEIEDFIKNKMPSETSKYDSEQQDYLHILEDYQLSDEQLLGVGRKLEENRNDRKQWHNIFTISSVWSEHKGKVFNRNSRIFLKEGLSKVIKNLDSDWNFRVLSEEEVSKLLNDTKATVSKDTKRGRKSLFNQDVIDTMLTYYVNGVKAKEISERMNIKLPTVYAILKKNKDKVM